MAIALVTGAHLTLAGNGTSADITTSGASLFVAILAYSTGDSIVLADNDSMTWNAGLTVATGDFGGEARLYYALGSGRSGHHFTVSGGTTPGLCVAAFSGTATSSPFDQQNQANNQTTIADAGSITPTQNNELVISCCTGATVIAVDSPYTVTDILNGVGGVNWGAAMAYNVQTTATATDPTWTTPTFGSGAKIASFKEPGAASGGGPLVKGNLLRGGGLSLGGRLISFQSLILPKKQFWLSSGRSSA